jgi:hypothetical protein
MRAASIVLTCVALAGVVAGPDGAAAQDLLKVSVPQRGSWDNVRDYIPRAAVDPGRIAGMSEIIADAVQLKFIAAPLAESQTRELVQTP